MGMIYSVGKDTCRIVDEMKEILTLTFKITISIVTIIQDIEDVILELKDLSDMLHFSINSVDRSKVNDRLDHLKVIIAELRNKASQKHLVLDFLSMIVEDGLKMRYGERKTDGSSNGTKTSTEKSEDIIDTNEVTGGSRRSADDNVHEITQTKNLNSTVIEGSTVASVDGMGNKEEVALK